MKKSISILVFALFTLISNGQTVKINASGNYTSISAKSQTVKPVNTGKTFEAKNGDTYPIFKSARGKYFIIRTSKNTGKKYNQYLKL
jgi:hypothetical protein